VVLGLWQALSRRDWEAVKTFLSDDCLYVDMPVPALSARGPEDIVKRLKMGLEPLAGYENHDGVLASNGSDVLYEHSETWTFTTGEQGVLRFVTVHKVALQEDEPKITVWKDYWDMNSLVAFAPPNHFENLANADTSWVFDATSLV
jgi:limonene-1,2-epoxide hydrolase